MSNRPPSARAQSSSASHFPLSASRRAWRIAQATRSALVPPSGCGSASLARQCPTLQLHIDTHRRAVAPPNVPCPDRQLRVEVRRAAHWPRFRARSRLPLILCATSVFSVVNSSAAFSLCRISHICNAAAKYRLASHTAKTGLYCADRTVFRPRPVLAPTHFMQLPKLAGAGKMPALQRECRGAMGETEGGCR